MANPVVPSAPSAFRYLDLPKEMQTEILSHVDTATCRQVALCSKRARNSTLPSLFANVRLLQDSRPSFPTIRLTQFPVDASTHVRSFHFSLPVVSLCDPDAKSTRSGIAAHFGALSGMGNLANLTLTIDIRSSPLLEDVERPLSVLRSNVQAIAARARGCQFDVEILGGWLDGQGGAYAASLAVLEAVLEPLIGTRITRLSFQEFFNGERPAVPYRNQPAYLAFGRLASTVQELHLSGPGWLLWSPDPVPIPDLKAMTLHIPVELGGHEMAFLRSNFHLFVNAAAETLETLHLDVTTWLSPQEHHRPGQGLLCPVLKRLVLSGFALKEFFPYIQTLPCESLQVTVNVLEDWRELHELLSREARTFPCLRKIHVLWEAFCFAEPQNFIETYDEIKAILLANNVECTVEIVEDKWEGLDAFTAVRSLACLGRELVSFDAPLWPMQQNEESLHPDHHPAVSLPKLSNMRIVVDETLSDDHSSAGPTLSAILGRIQSPMLEVITLSISTPYTEYLPILEKAIRAGAAFPALKRIVGTYILEDRPGNWAGKTAKHRKERFIHACRGAGIGLVDFEWHEC